MVNTAKRLLSMTSLASMVAWQSIALAQNFPPGACTLVPNSETCVDAIPCKTDSNGITACLAGAPLPPGGISLPQTCWHYTYQYACADPTQSTDTCAPYATNPVCSLISSTCQDTQQPSGTCDDWTYTYQCQTQPAQTSQQVVCTNGLFDTGQFPTPQNPNSTFVLAAVSQEILRQGQLYSDQGTELFAGVHETCRKGYAGIQNCCKSAPGAMANSAISHVAFGAAASVVKYLGSEAIDWASPYVFDAMYNNGIWTDAMTSAFATGGDTFGTTLASSGFTVGAYGFSYSAGGFVQGSGLMGANADILDFPGGGALEFNPYALAAAIALHVVMSLLSCTPDEQMLAQHKGAHLSVYERTDCTQRFLGTCLQHTDTYCSFNSVLAKIIQTQGKAQLGLDPSDCSGLSIAQVQRLDFTHIDFSEFTASITAKASTGLPNNTSIQQAYSPVMQSITGGSAQTGSMLTNSNVTGSTPNSNSPPPNPALPTYPN